MASSSQHPSFPIRQFPASTSAPPQLAVSTRGKPLNFAQSHAPAARETARLERERHAQQAAQQSAQSQAPSPMSQLTDEQRDEVNEAVSLRLDEFTKYGADNTTVRVV